MKVLVVSSMHISSTRDVWMKIVAGLQMQGVDARGFDLMQRLRLFAFLEEKVKRSKQKQLPRDWNAITLTYEPILGAALFHDVEWCIIVSPQYLPNEIPDLMRRAGIKTAAMFTECPYEDTIHTPLTASHFDVSFVSDKHSIGLFQSFCNRVEYLPHCFHPELHYPLENEEERNENVVFVGTGYGTRTKFMRSVEWPRPLELYGWWPKEWLRYDAPLRKCVKGETTSPPETADIYRHAGASFSMHREMRYVGSDESIMEGEAYSIGPRNYELAACGAFQVSDYRQELTDIFGDSVPLYQTPQELGALLKRAFDEPSWRREMAARQTELVQPYSCDKVMKTVADVLAA